MEFAQLNNGVKMPVLGLGSYQMKDPRQCEQVVADAIQLGYRLIDTAQSYGNEAAIGQALTKANVPRDRLFITTKLDVANQTYEKAIASFFESMQKLKLDYVDLVLLHHPYNDVYGAWRAMKQLQQDGYIRAIGISNFQADRLEDFILHAGKKPQLMQIETHPFNQQNQLVKIMKDNQIQAQAWSPLAQGSEHLFQNKDLIEIATSHHRTVAQVILRWLIQRHISVVAKSVHPERLQENLSIFDFSLTAAEMKQIANLNRDQSINPQLHNPNFVKVLSSF